MLPGTSLRSFVSSSLVCAGLLLAGCGHHTPSFNMITVEASDPSISAGTTTQLHASLSGTKQALTDVTRTVLWTSSDPAIATVDATGLLTGNGAGVTTITASLNGTSGRLEMAIGAPAVTSLSLTPSSVSVYTGGTQQFKASASYANHTSGDVSSSVQWNVFPNTIATIDSTGKLTAIAPGNFVVSGSLSMQTAIAQGTASNAPLFSLSITPAAASLVGGTTQQFTATGTFFDGTKQDLSSSVSWSSSNPTLLSVDARGLATADIATVTGTANLTAQLGSVSVTVPVMVTPSAVVTELHVEPSSSSIVNGSAERQTATAVYSDGTQQDVTSQVTWSVTGQGGTAPAQGGVVAARAFRPADASSNGVVNVDARGTISAQSGGLTTVQAAFAGISTQSVVIVTTDEPVSLAIRSDETVIPTGAQQQLHLVGTFANGSSQDLSLTANWQSSNAGVAPIDSTGLVQGLAPGDVQFSAAFGGLSAATTGFAVVAKTLAAIFVDVPIPAVVTGISEQLSVTGLYSDGSTHDLTSLASFTTSNDDVFTVSSGGLLQSQSPGVAQITASLGGLSAPTSVAAVPARISSIDILSPSTSFALGSTMDFTALGHFSDGFQADISSSAYWSSSDPTVFTIDGTGRAKSGRLGTAQVTATFKDASQTSYDVQVTDATLIRLSLTALSARLPAGQAQRYTATGIFSDGSFQDLSPDVVWSTADVGVASVDETGTVRGVSAGTTQVVGSLMGQTAMLPLTVSDATLLAVNITPGNTELPVDVNRPFHLIGSFSDGSQLDVTESALWSAGTPSVATVQLKGQVSGIGVGVGTISARLGFFTASTPVQVTDATLSSIALTPASSTIRKGTQQQLVGTGTFSDGFQQDLYLNAVFRAADNTVASVVASALASATGVGTTQITATFRGQTALATLQVTSDILSTLAITPANPPLVSGGSQQFTATGTYADGSTSDLSSMVVWSSSNPAVLSIDQNGLTTVHGTTVPVQVVLTATSGRTVKTITVTVSPAPVAATLTSLAVTPGSASVNAGSTLQLSAMGMYSDGTTRDLSSSATWTSQNSLVVVVNNKGLLGGLMAGTTSVQAMMGPLAATAAIRVTAAPGTGQGSAATLTSLTVFPTSGHLAAGTTLQLSAVGTYSDATTQDLTSRVTWSSTSGAIARVDSSGLVSGLTPGLVSIQAQVAANGSVFSNTAAIRVTSATLTSVAISPSGASLAAGVSQQFTLTGTYSDGSTQSLNAQAVWTSSAPSVASISTTGLAMGVAPGTVRFSASYGGLTGTTPNVSVTNAMLVSIAVTPASPSFAKGTTQQFTVTGTYSDGTTHDVTSMAFFSSSDATVVSISGSGLASGLGMGATQISVTAGGQTAHTQTVTVTAATLVSIAVTPVSPSFANGTTQQFTATGTFSDGTTQNLTSQVTWTSSAASVLTINSTGLASSGGVGPVQVSANLNGVSASTGTVQVTAATLTSLAIAPTSARIAKGTVVQFMVTGTYSDGTTRDLSTQATWTSSDGTVVSIDANGLATGNGVGSAQITAGSGGRSVSTASFQVTPATLVSVSFNPAQPVVAAGTTGHVSVIGTFSDGTTQDITSTAMFSSSNPAVASVSPYGVVSGVAAGTSIITVQDQGMSSSFTVVVSSATLSSIAITPASLPGFAKGTTVQFHATGTFSDGSTQDLTSAVTWISSNQLVFSIDSMGLATGTGAGSASLTAAYQGESATFPAVQVSPATLASVTVTPANATAVVGSTQQFLAVGTYTDSTTQDLTNSANWTSSNPLVASINATGLASAVLPGVSTIQARVPGLSGTATLTVTAVPPPTLLTITVTPVAVSLATGSTQQFNATGIYSDGSTQNLNSAVAWSASDSSVVTVSATGLATAVQAGSAMIQARFSGSLGSANVTVTMAATPPPVTLQAIAVTPATATIVVGGTQQFMATGTYSDGSTQNLSGSVSWSSSSPSVATVNGSGLASGLQAGSAFIQVQFNGVSGSASLTVSAASSLPTPTLQAITLTPASSTIVLGGTQQFTASGIYSDGTTQNLTSSVAWSSSNTLVATVNSAGLATAVLIGTTTIQGQFNGLSGSAVLTVVVVPAQAPTLQSITLAPSTSSLVAGSTLQYTATGNYSDGSTQNLTSTATWSSSDTSVATVNGSGLATAVQAGSAMIQAQVSGVSGTAVLAVTATPVATLQSITIGPVSASVPAGGTQQFTATGTYSDGTMQNLTSTATWSSSAPAVATVSATGLATTAQAGTATIQAQLNGASGTANLTVTPVSVMPSLQAVTITPGVASLIVGATQQFTATGVYSDGSTQNVTGSTTWSSSSSSIATVNASGLATAAQIGTTTIRGQFNGVMGSATLVVSQASMPVLQLITVAPTVISLGTGMTEQFAASGQYSDGSTQNLTSMVTWSSSIPSVATINANGLATTVGAGTTAVQAQLNGTIGAAVLVVTPASVPTPPTLLSVTITPTSASLTVGMTQQFTATGHYSDGSTQDLTGTATWISSNPVSATVSASGLVSAVHAGSASIQALINGTMSSSNVTITAAAVTLQSLAVTPTAASIPYAGTLQYSAIGTYSDGSTQNLTANVTWQSSVVIVAVIASNGLAVGLSGGSTQIGATYQGRTAATTLTVSPATLTSVAITPHTAALANGTTQQLTATGTFSDGSTEDLTNTVVWSTSNSSMATVSLVGLVRATGVGSATITAQDGSVSATASITISAATPVSVQVTPSVVALAAGNIQQLLTTATFTDNSSQDVTSSATYTTSSASVATVDASGKLTAVGPGVATVTVGLGSVSATVTVTTSNAVLVSLALSPSPLSLAVGTSQQLAAMGTFSDGSTRDLTGSVVWTSSAPTVAAVSPTGLVLIAQTGSATISSTSVNGVTATVNVTGTTAAVVSIAVSPAAVTLGTGQTQQFAATATLSDGTQQTVTNSAHWSIGDATKATVSDSSPTKGFLTSSAAGLTTVSASVNSVSGSAVVTIQAAILTSLTIAPSPVSLPAGTTQALTVTGHYTDGSTSNLNGSTTWTTLNASTATVDSTGNVHGIAAGSTTVVATVHGVAGTVSVTVTAAQLSSISIAPATLSLVAGLHAQLTATGTYTDGSSQDISTHVQWSSSTPTVATVSASGLVNALVTGSSNVSASLSGVAAQVPVTVTGATLQSIAVSAGQTSFALGLSLQLAATGTYSDGSTHDLTATVTWSSLTPAVGVVSASGVATGVSAGTFNARATLGGVSGQLGVTVSNAVLVSLAITPGNATIINVFGNTLQYTATGTFSNGSTQNLTTSVHWAISAGISVGSISQTGRLTPLSVGLGTITVTSGAISGSTGFIVAAF